MTKEELLLGCAQWIRDYDWWDVNDYFDSFDLSCIPVDSYVADANDKGYEQHEVYFVSDRIGVEEPEIFFYLIIAWCGGRWGENVGPSLVEAFPKQVTRYTLSEDYMDKLED